MTRLIIPAAKELLVAGRDIDLIACQRKLDDQQGRGQRAFGIRWAARPDLGFPLKGWNIRRYVIGGSVDTVGGAPFMLPRTASWTEFEADAEARRPWYGPYFPSFEAANFGFLLDLVRLVDPRTSSIEWLVLTTRVAEFFGQSHEGNAELAWYFWRQSSPPSLSDLLAGAASAAVIAYYRNVTTRFLYALSLRFEYACLFGMATDDVVKGDNSVQYEVEATWPNNGGFARSDGHRTNANCAPAAPAYLAVTRTPGSVSYPAFSAFTGWVPPDELAPRNSDGTPLPPEYWVPRSPAMFSALEWAASQRVETLLHYNPVLYEITRFDFGAGSAGTTTAPALPAGAVFKAVEDGELTQRSDPPPHYLDRPGMPWPPLEGHYVYRVRGVDYLGVKSFGAAEASVRHHDELPPPSPEVRVVAGTMLAFAAAGDTVEVKLNIVWTAAEDFGGPDTSEFRVATRWIPRTVVAISIESDAEVDNLTGMLTVTSLDGLADQYVGVPVVTPEGGYIIKSHTLGVPATITVYKSSGRLPSAPTNGVIHSAVVPGPLTRVGRLARRPAVAATVASVVSDDPLEIRLLQAGSAALPGSEAVHVYLHGLRVSLQGTPTGPAQWRLEVPVDADARATTLNNWRALANHNVLLTGTPAIVYPQHGLTVAVAAPSDFLAGLLELHVTAADDKTYVASPVYPVADVALGNARGNESEAAVAVVSVRCLDPPSQPTVSSYDPATILWSTSAADYAESATYKLQWGAVAGVAQFEVWRALEGSLTGASADTSDEDLRTLAAAQGDAFDLRSGEVFTNLYEDSIPGRAPTRALYRVRAIAASGEKGPWTDIIGPVHVPDVRAPVRPNLLSAGPPADGTERAIQVTWTQAGPVDGVRFDIEAKRAGDTAFSVIGVVPKGTTPNATGRYTFTDADVVPGKESVYRVIPVREARDPIDPTGVALRDVAGTTSKEIRTSAIGQLEAPSDVVANYDAASNSVAVSWVNQDSYETVEVRRMAPGRYAFATLTSLAGDAKSFSDTDISSGDWKYQIRGLGVSRRADSEVNAEVTVP